MLVVCATSILAFEWFALGTAQAQPAAAATNETRILLVSGIDYPGHL